MDRYNCPRCEFHAFPGFVLDAAGKLIVECPRCQYLEPSLSPASFNSGVAVTEQTETVGWAGKTATVVSTKPDPIAAHAFATMTAPPPVGSVRAEPADVIGWIEQRSLWLVTEEARVTGELASAKSRLASVRAEQRSLSKMLKVARPRECSAPDPSKN